MGAQTSLPKVEYHRNIISVEKVGKFDETILKLTIMAKEMEFLFSSMTAIFTKFLLFFKCSK